MKIEKLNLKNFRNYESLDLSFSNETHLFHGINAGGKTNVVEAIFLLTEGNSFRTEDHRRLIKEGAESAIVTGVFFNGENHKEISIELTSSGKRILVNGKKIAKLSELYLMNKTICIAPKDAFFFFQEPKFKRMYFNSVIAKDSFLYLQTLAEFKDVLSERNSMLKNEFIDENAIGILNEKFAKDTEIIIKARTELVRKINERINNVLKEITTNDLQVVLEYFPSIKVCENFKENILQKLIENFELDKLRKFTSFGPQKDDFKMLVNGFDICEKCSNGQIKLITIAMKLTILDIFNVIDENPILILDDIFSELDRKNSLKIVEYLKRYKQVFVTSTRGMKQMVHKYLVKNNRVIKEDKL